MMAMTSEKTLQVNLKMRGELAERFASCAAALGLDLANLARSIIAEHLAGVEERAARARPAPAKKK